MSKEKKALLKKLGKTIKEKPEEEKEMEVITEGAEDESLPVTDDVECDECGNGKARFWMKQMRSGDEPETQFFKCTECGHIWRD